MVVEELPEQQEEDNHYESNGSHKHDSCLNPSDDEESELEIATNTFDNQKRSSKVQSPTTSSKSPNLSTFKKQAVLAPSKQELQQEQMKRTFQTNEEREDYYQHMNALTEKFSSLNLKADDARKEQWDTRKELKKVAQTKSKATSLAASKKSFRRNRDRDNIILNERSGDLMSQVS